MPNGNCSEAIDDPYRLNGVAQHGSGFRRRLRDTLPDKLHATTFSYRRRGSRTVTPRAKKTRHRADSAAPVPRSQTSSVVDALVRCL